MTEVGQWNIILNAKVVDYLKDETGRNIFWLELYDKEVSEIKKAISY